MKKPPSKLQEFHLDLDPIAETVVSATTASPMIPADQVHLTQAISDELGQVESFLETLTPEAGKKSATSISELQTKNLELELELTRAKIKFARLQPDLNHVGRSKMAAPKPANETRRTKTKLQPEDRPSLL